MVCTETHDEGNLCIVNRCFYCKVLSPKEKETYTKYKEHIWVRKKDRKKPCASIGAYLGKLCIPWRRDSIQINEKCIWLGTVSHAYGNLNK